MIGKFNNQKRQNNINYNNIIYNKNNLPMNTRHYDINYVEGDINTNDNCFFGYPNVKFMFFYLLKTIFSLLCLLF